MKEAKDDDDDDDDDGDLFVSRCFCKTWKAFTVQHPMDTRNRKHIVNCVVVMIDVILMLELAITRLNRREPI